MMTRFVAPCCLVVGMFPFLFAGCGSPKVEPVEGTVSFEGQPVKAGSVTFLPKGDGSRETKFLPTSAGIMDGRFTLPKSMGVGRQAYKIVVIGFDGVPIEFSSEGTKIFKDYEFEHDFDSQEKTLDIVVPESLKIRTTKKK